MSTIKKLLISVYVHQANLGWRSFFYRQDIQSGFALSNLACIK